MYAFSFFDTFLIQLGFIMQCIREYTGRYYYEEEAFTMYHNGYIMLVGL